jgi:hypothetical protein
MPKKEVPVEELADFLPEGCAEDALYFLHHYTVELTIKRKRASVLGDYRHAHAGHTHRISVNGNLNKYAFLITLLHELAHLLTFEKHGNRVQPHGLEWKSAFSEILVRFLAKKVFPADIEQALQKTIRNPSASSCSDENLLRVLHRYDKKGPDICLVENITLHSHFSLADGRVFRKGEKVRTRYVCTDIETGRRYLFSGVHEVRLVTALV